MLSYISIFIKDKDTIPSYLSAKISFRKPE